MSVAGTDLRLGLPRGATVATYVDLGRSDPCSTPPWQAGVGGPALRVLASISTYDDPGGGELTCVYAVSEGRPQQVTDQVVAAIRSSGASATVGAVPVGRDTVPRVEASSVHGLVAVVFPVVDRGRVLLVVASGGDPAATSILQV